jgi:indole-3-glycerol phosphate synthase
VTSARAAWLDQARAALAALDGLSLTEIVPSRRDFTQFVATQKQGIALVPRLQRCDPETGRAWPGRDLIELARACDDADVAGLAVRTAALHGGAIADLDAVAAAATAPLLRDDLCVDRHQIYEARLHGADAVLLPADVLDAAALAALAGVAASMHMASVIDVGDDGELGDALAVPTACLGLRATTADGWADLARIGALAARIPRQRTVLLLSEVARLDDLRRLDGQIDAALVGAALLDLDDPAAAIAAFAAPAP